MFTHDFNFNKDATYFKVPQIVELEQIEKFLKAKNRNQNFIFYSSN